MRLSCSGFNEVQQYLSVPKFLINGNTVLTTRGPLRQRGTPWKLLSMQSQTSSVIFTSSLRDLLARLAAPVGRDTRLIACTGVKTYNLRYILEVTERVVLANIVVTSPVSFSTAKWEQWSFSNLWMVWAAGHVNFDIHHLSKWQRPKKDLNSSTFVRCCTLCIR